MGSARQARNLQLGSRPEVNAVMTLLWFLIWLIANNVGGHEPLTFDPVNAWTGTLLLTIALDLGKQHAPTRRMKG